MGKFVPCFPYPFIFYSGNENMLIASDTHFGIEEELFRNGFTIKDTSKKFLNDIEKCRKTKKVNTILLLGDVKNEIGISPNSEMVLGAMMKRLNELFSRVIIVRGNHDGNIEKIVPSDTEIYESSGCVIENTAFFHGHAWPSEDLVKKKIMVSAHVHPGIGILRWNGKVTVKKCFAVGEPDITEWHKKYDDVKIKKIMLIPAWNDYCGTSLLNDQNRSKKGIILRNSLMDLDKTEIYLMDSTYIGNLSNVTISTHSSL